MNLLPPVPTHENDHRHRAFRLEQMPGVIDPGYNL